MCNIIIHLAVERGNADRYDSDDNDKGREKKLVTYTVANSNKFLDANSSGRLHSRSGSNRLLHRLLRRQLSWHWLHRHRHHGWCWCDSGGLFDRLRLFGARHCQLIEVKCVGCLGVKVLWRSRTELLNKCSAEFGCVGCVWRVDVLNGGLTKK